MRGFLFTFVVRGRVLFDYLLQNLEVTFYESIKHYGTGGISESVNALVVSCM